MKNTLMLIALTAVALVAQPPRGQHPAPPDGTGRDTKVEGYGPSFEKAADYFGFTDSQLQKLEQIHQSEREALEPLMNKVRQAAPDAPETEALRSELANKRKPFRLQAQAVLTTEQKTKLAALAAAAELSPAIHESAMLNLIEAPARPPHGPQGPPPIE